MSDKVYGIDLGTTYSAVAAVNDLGQAEIIKNFMGEDTTPSVLYFEEDGSVTIGTQAKRTQLADPDNACSLIKRHMGTVHPLSFRDAEYTPESLSALILKELVNNANSQNGLSINKAVITVPAYFGVQERAATRQAGEIAGLDVVAIIPEPVAAAISLAAGQSEEQTFLIFDLGGGTFDTTIMRVRQGGVDVVVTDGNRLLGGADWDQRLEDILLAKFTEQVDLGDEDPTIDDDFMTELKLDVEDIKKTLTVRPDTTHLLRFEGHRANISISRQEFEDATQDLVAQTMEIVQRTLTNAQQKEPGITITRTLLVGGSSRMPMIEKALQAGGFNPEKTDFDLSVAKGAALFGQGEVAWEIGSENPDDDDTTTAERSDVPGIRPPRTVVQQVLSRGLGVMVSRETGRPAPDQYEDYITFLAHTNQTLPLTATMQGAILHDGQTAVEVGLYEQGGEVESEDPGANTAMVTGPATTICDLPPMRKGDPINVELQVSAEGLATLVVVEPASGKSFSAEAMVAVLTQEEVDQARQQIARITTTS